MSELVEPVYEVDTYTDPFTHTDEDIALLGFSDDASERLQELDSDRGHLPTIAHLQARDWLARYYFTVDTGRVADPEEHIKQVGRAVLTDPYALPRDATLAQFKNWMEVKKGGNEWRVMVAWEPLDDAALP